MVTKVQMKIFFCVCCLLLYCRPQERYQLCFPSFNFNKYYTDIQQSQNFAECSF